MAVIKDRQVNEVERDRELLLVGDTVKLIDSSYDRLKKGASGRVTTLVGDLATDPEALIAVTFKLAGQPFVLQASANRFRFAAHAKGEELPDAESTGALDEPEAAE